MDATPEHLSRDDITRQVQQQLESLRAAGIEWFPKAAALTLAIPEQGQAECQPSAVGESLFQEAAPAPHDSRDNRLIELSVLQAAVAGCTRCPELVSTRTQTVFGVGPIDPEICFIGEAPGADEDRQGEPFVGAAGQLLNRIIAAMGMKREEVYICNILRCRPPGNRVPKSEEARNCREHLDRQLDIVRPKFICTLGATAAQNLLGTTTPIGRMRGKFYEYRGIAVLCTYHPASLLPHRSPEKKKDVWEDMKMLLTRMGKPIPVQGSDKRG